MTKWIVAAALCLATLVGAAPRAEADGGTGYLCSVRMNPSWPGAGSAGYLTYSEYSGPACSGSYLGYGYICSSGATNTGMCYTAAPYSEAQINSVFQALQRAMIMGERVYIEYSSTFRGVEFLGN